MMHFDIESTLSPVYTMYIKTISLQLSNLRGNFLAHAKKKMSVD